MVVKINGKEVSRTEVIVKKAFEVVDDVAVFVVNSFHNVIEMAIKIGLLVFLFPYISKFFLLLVEVIKGAAGA
jgi:hypothetical protein